MGDTVVKGEGMSFYSPEEGIIAFNENVRTCTRSSK